MLRCSLRLVGKSEGVDDTAPRRGNRKAIGEYGTDVRRVLLWARVARPRVGRLLAVCRRRSAGALRLHHHRFREAPKG
jgi:hypothetical protein